MNNENRLGNSRIEWQVLRLQGVSLLGAQDEFNEVAGSLSN